MGFLNETAKALGIEQGITNQSFCYISPDNGIVVEGYKKVYELSIARIVLLLIDGRRIEILGNNLTIKELSHREISILGSISTVNFV